MRLPKVMTYLDKNQGIGRVNSQSSFRANTTISTIASLKPETERVSIKSPPQKPKARNEQKVVSIALGEFLAKKPEKKVGLVNKYQQASEKLKQIAQTKPIEKKQPQKKNQFNIGKVVKTEGAVDDDFKDFQFNLIDLNCSSDGESDNRTDSSASFSDINATPRFNKNKGSQLKSIAAQFARKIHEETPICDDLSESFFGSPKNVYVFQVNLHSLIK